MPNYVLTYRLPATQEPSPDTMDAWTAFLGELGEHLVDAGQPAFSRTSIGNTGAGTELCGYSMITADDLESAAALAKGCPPVGAGGGVEVGELTPM